MNISGHTRLAGVIGNPVRHSLSPALLNAAFEAADLDVRYFAFEVDDAVAALVAARTFGFLGLSVTMPHKAAVAAAVDERSSAADALGAVNCVICRPDGTLRGENTDGQGFIDGLRRDASFDAQGARCVVIGAGGAARAVVHGLHQAGASQVAVINRTAERAADAASLAGERGVVGSAADLAGADLVVNATSVGMVGGPEGMPVDPAALSAGQLAVDLIYSPRQTAWMRALDARGIEVYNGVSMLLCQAALAFSLWTGADAPLSAMSDALEGQLFD